MHEKLKFSFGHILAFLALIFIGYITFTGVTYYTQGSYFIGGIVAVVIIVVLLILLFRLQLLKSVNAHFEEKVVHERATFTLLTAACLASFIPFSHFWSVKSHEDSIVASYKNSFNTSRQLFLNYDSYCEKRIATYDSILHHSTHSQVINDVLLKGLKMQLQPQKFLDLEEDFRSWLGRSEKGASIWNVFLVGNVNKLCESMAAWDTTMHQQSSIRIQGEPIATSAPFTRKQQIETSIFQLQDSIPYYTAFHFPTGESWISGVMAFAMLYLPWGIQRRSPKSLVTFLGKRKIKIHGGKLDESPTHAVKTKKLAGELEQQDANNVGKKHLGQTLDNDGQPRRSRFRAMTLDDDGTTRSKE